MIDFLHAISNIGLFLFGIFAWTFFIGLFLVAIFYLLSHLVAYIMYRLRKEPTIDDYYDEEE